MNFQDLHNNIKTVRALSPVATPADNTAQVSQIIDRKDYEGVEFIIATGALPDADATWAVTMDEGDAANLSDAVAVSGAPGLVGTLAAASFIFSDDDKTFKVGYTGAKRYVRLTITPTNNSSASLMSVIAVLYRGRFLGQQLGPGAYPQTEGTPISD